MWWFLWLTNLFVVILGLATAISIYYVVIAGIKLYKSKRREDK